jgi:DNA repair protein RAD7
MSRNKVKFSGGESEDARKKRQREHAVNRAEHFALAENESGIAADVTSSSSRGRSLRQSTPSGVVYHASASQFGDEDAGIRGPFSIASQILANADSVRMDREKQWASLKDGNDLTEEQEQCLDKYDKILLQLMRDKASKTKLGSTRTRIRVQTGPIDSLTILTVRTLVAVFDRVGDLYGVSNESRVLIAEELAKARRLDDRAALLLATTGSDCLSLPECSLLDERTVLQAVDRMVQGLSSTEKENLADLEPCPLKCLFLRNCGHALSDKAAVHLATRISALEVLGLTGCYKLNDESFQKLMQPFLDAGQDSFLRELDLSANSRLRSGSMEAIARLVTLESLTLNDAIHLTDKDMQVLVGTQSEPVAGAEKLLPKLKHISLNGLINITDQCLIPLVSCYGSQLNTIDISGCAKLTGSTLTQVRESCSQLHHLNISHLTDITEVHLLGLFLCPEVQEEEAKGSLRTGMDISESQDSLQNVGGNEREAAADGGTVIGPIRRLTIANLVGITDQVMRHISVSFGAHLERLDFGGCNKISSRTVILLATHCPSIHYMDMSFCRGIQNEALNYLVNCSRSLSELHVWGCTQLTDAFFNGHTKLDLLVCGNNRLGNEDR